MRRDPGAVGRVLAQRFKAEALGLEPDDQRLQVGRRPWILTRPDTQVREQDVSRLDLVERLLQQLFVAELLARQLVAQETRWRPADMLVAAALGSRQELR